MMALNVKIGVSMLRQQLAGSWRAERQDLTGIGVSTRLARSVLQRVVLTPQVSRTTGLPRGIPPHSAGDRAAGDRAVSARYYREADVIKKILQFLVLKRLWNRRRGRR